MPADTITAAGTPPERQTVLHSWCVQSDWHAPTIVGGAGARLHTDDGRTILDMSSLAECSNLGHQHPPWPAMHQALRALIGRAPAEGVSFAARGNLLLLAPPLVITDRELADALTLLDRLLGELGTTLAAERTS